MPIYDISVTISPSMARWPGDPPVAIVPDKTVAADGYAVSRLSLGSHTGTHIDAPRHVMEGGLGASRIPLETLIGPAYVFEVDPSDPADPLVIHSTDLVTLGIPHNIDRVLLKTSNSRLWESPEVFEEHYLSLTRRAAHWIAGRGLKLLGFDYVSVDPFGSKDLPAHMELLGAGVIILECLNLSNVPAGVYQLVALPLKTGIADGAPVRAVLIR